MTADKADTRKWQRRPRMEVRALVRKVIQSHHKANQAEAPAVWSNKSTRQRAEAASGYRLHVLALELPQLSKYLVLAHLDND